MTCIDLSSAGNVGTGCRQNNFPGLTDYLLPHFPHNVPVKEMWKSIDILRRYGQKFEAWPTL